jgi:hypothetical protein
MFEFLISILLGCGEISRILAVCATLVTLDCFQMVALIASSTGALQDHHCRGDHRCGHHFC